MTHASCGHFFLNLGGQPSAARENVANTQDHKVRARDREQGKNSSDLSGHAFAATLPLDSSST